MAKAKATARRSTEVAARRRRVLKEAAHGLDLSLGDPAPERSAQAVLSRPPPPI
jgi:hypothetical protein